jgi:hypothetical protein
MKAGSNNCLFYMQKFKWKKSPSPSRLGGWGISAKVFEI